MVMAQEEGKSMAMATPSLSQEGEAVYDQDYHFLFPEK